MIYHLYFALIMAGYSACGILLGSYMMLYAGARELDLGLLFMIQPMTIFLRPLICARADRTRGHKRMLVWFTLLTSLAYAPFIVIPLLMQSSRSPGSLLGPGQSSARKRFWILALSHLLGSVGFCGVRSLGDALAVNYAKRIGTDYARYRKYGAISFGLCGYLLGHVNQNWILPDFVPSMMVYSSTMLLMALLVFVWPDEYFVIVSRSQQEALARNPELAKPLPGSRGIVEHMGSRLRNLLGCHSIGGGRTAVEVKKKELKTGESHDMVGEATRKEKRKSLAIGQQLRILSLLLRADFRIGLYLLILFYGGLVGYAGPNFVFTYLNETCHRKATCDAASLAGLVMVSYCLVETCCYLLIDRFRGKLNYLLMVEITFVSLAAHYFFYGYALDHLSPYFFLAESLHGVEYAISLSTSVELGYLFANEVELLIPELIRRDIIRPEDDQELIKVSLMATMSGLMTLVYDGLGSILGSLVYGLTTGHYSFVTTWRVIGTLASCGFVVILVGYLVGKWLGLEPRIHKLKAERRTDQR